MNARLLDLFSGAGGAATGYARAGFTVTGVDIAEQPHYPFAFVHRDALAILTEPRWAGFLAEYDVIHASPPCQYFSAYRRRGSGVGESYPDLIAPVRAGLQATGKVYVIENIPRSPLHDPVTVCGSSFGLDVQRHRLFESNVPLVAPPCNHAWQTPRFPPATNRANLRRTVEVGAYRCHRYAASAMGIDWMNRAELTEAIPPPYTEFLGRQIHAWLRARFETLEFAE
jgi:DNA (cytosine-5)-methyltransferase 1